MKANQVGYVLIAVIALGILGIVVRVIATDSDLPKLALEADLSQTTVDRVVMSDGQSTVELREEDGRWMVGPYPVVAWKLDGLWEAVGKLDRADLIASNPDNHVVMGVSPFNGTQVQFLSNEVLQDRLILGHREFIVQGGYNASPWTRQVQLCYVRREGEDEVFGIHCPLPDQFFPHPFAWADPLIVSVPRTEIETMTYKHPDTEFKLIKDGADWILEGRLDTGGRSRGGETAAARLVTVFDLRVALELLVTSDFPDEDVRDTLDFSQPDASLLIEFADSSEEEPVLLLFLEEEGGGYHIKDATKPYSYLLNQRDAATVLIPRPEFEPLPTATPEPTPTP